MGINALEVAQNVEMQRACFDTRSQALPQPRKMVFCRGTLSLTDNNLFLDQLPGDLDVPGDEHR